jgi:predicted type IV restriction endonuclease
MTAPDLIQQLVQRFEDNRALYRSGNYNEARLRLEFLDPFFKALGWDVNNEQGYAEAYKDVIVEDSLEVEGAAKAPDYAFRIGGTRKFFVEAKKPSRKGSV